MWNFSKRSWGINVLLVAVAAAVSFGAYKEIRLALALREEERGQRVKIAELEKKKEELEARIRAFGHPEGVVREAKERLNLKKPGEEVVVVVPPVAPSASTSGQAFFWDGIKRVLSALFSF